MLSIRVTVYFFALFLFLCLNRFVAGGCLNYGHSCWGGHGKRSAEGREHGGLMPRVRNSDWYLTRLLQAQRDSLIPESRQAMDLSNIFGAENVVRDPESLSFNFLPVQNSQNNRQGIVGDAEPDDSEGWSPEANDSAPELVVVSPEDAGTPKLRLYQLLNDGSLRKNSVG